MTLKITGEELIKALEANYTLTCVQLIAGNIESAKDCVRAMLWNIEEWEKQGDRRESEISIE